MAYGKSQDNNYNIRERSGSSESMDYLFGSCQGIMELLTHLATDETYDSHLEVKE